MRGRRSSTRRAIKKQMNNGWEAMLGGEQALVGPVLDVGASGMSPDLISVKSHPAG